MKRSEFVKTMSELLTPLFQELREHYDNERKFKRASEDIINKVAYYVDHYVVPLAPEDEIGISCGTPEKIKNLGSV